MSVYTFERRLLKNPMYTVSVHKNDEHLHINMEIISEYVPFNEFKTLILKGLKKYKNSNVTNDYINQIIVQMNKNEIKVKGRTFINFALIGTKFFFSFNNNDTDGRLSITYPKDNKTLELLDIPIKKSLKNALIKIYSEDGLLEKNSKGTGTSFQNLFKESS